MIEISSSDDDAGAASSSNPQLPSHGSVHVGAEPAQPAPAPKRHGSDLLWGELTGHGICIGSNQLPCYFGTNGGAANAGPDGRCDLCSGDAMRELHRSMPQRLTHLLTGLEGKPLQHALVRLKLVLGETIMAEYQARRQRALHRRDPNRPKRGPRQTRTEDGI